MSRALNIFLPAAASAMFSYVWLFNFVHGLSAEMLMKRLSSHQGRMHLLRTAFSFGFLKSSIRRCGHFYYRLLIHPVRIAKLGVPVPNRGSTLFALQKDGTNAAQSMSLGQLVDQAAAANEPLVIICGSWS